MRKTTKGAPPDAPKTNLPATFVREVENLRAAATSVGSGGRGGTYLKVDDRHGALVFGANRDPFPAKHRYAVNLRSFLHGFIVFGDSTERHMVPMHQQPVRPTPPGGYRTAFGEAGPTDATEITLTDLDEPGFEATFTATGASSANRLRGLLEDALAHLGTEEGRLGFIHPVIRVRAENYEHKATGRTVHHFGYELVDWLRDDGALLSQAPVRVGGPGAAAPWEVEEELEPA